ncbi:50S ribosomal protein L25 [Marinithermus hydrothermalis]|uniref:Large ribosomal subunit protein bL25 n=1 Tax=Marinithermus hydrothermalis (strain DSM 14884 / JCM 11576 / T1) TaxID=869210 RepID=F2NKW0_MARHT|nr:50S ribosomal protein L25 [Marinithermus hydrothermalis]AEB11149.1 50S ribosomal protein L25 [Marinithermus hydrothermalis DSM 14884]
MEYRLKAYTRENENPKQLRAQGKLPGVLYNKEINRKIYVELNEFDKVFRKASIHHVITLELPDGTTYDTLVRQLNLDKRRRRPEHVDFFVLSDEPVEMYVPLKFVGTAEGVRLGGVLEQVLHDVLVRVAPRNIPEFIEVDVSGLGIGQSLHLADITLPEGVELAMSPEETVVTVVPPEDVEALEAAEVTEGEMEEPEVIRRGKAEEAEE